MAGAFQQDPVNGKDCMTVSVFDFEAELNACAAGDQSAFLALYQQESPAMRTLALAMLDDAGAADAVLHETLVLIWRNAAGYSPAIGTARAWIYSILRYRAAAYARQMGTGGHRPAEQTPLPQLNLPTDAPADTLAGALAALPDPQRDALLQAYLHGGDAARIA